MSTAQVQDRTVVFEEQMLGWLDQVRPGVPVFVLPDVKTIKAGSCISCGVILKAVGWRCGPCLEAVNSTISGFFR